MPDANADQATFWNTVAGPTWVANEADLDLLHRPVTELLIAAVDPAAGDAVLDVGCGGGATSLAFAAAVGPTGHVLGVDVSAPLLARAEARRWEAGLGQIAFLEADAQTYNFQAPELALWPGLAVALAVLGLNMLGDGLRDLLDPRLRLMRVG